MIQREDSTAVALDPETIHRIANIAASGIHAHVGAGRIQARARGQAQAAAEHERRILAK
jgi:hypothetical protein